MNRWMAGDGSTYFAPLSSARTFNAFLFRSILTKARAGAMTRIKEKLSSDRSGRGRG